jgi:hypothetical protein
MNSVTGLLRSKRQLVVLLFLLYFLRLVIKLVFPNPGVDGPLYLSHAFSVLRGKFFVNEFLQEHIPVFNFPYFFGLLNAPFYALFTGSFLMPYSIIILNLAWTACFLYFSFKYLKDDTSGIKKFALFSLAFAINSYINGTRSELFILPFFILLFVWLKKTFVERNKLYSLLLTPFLLSAIGLMHPVAGVFASLVALLYAHENKAGLKTTIQFFICVAVILSALYIPVIQIDFAAWKRDFLGVGFEKRRHSFIDVKPLLKYLVLNPALVILILIIVFNSKNRIKETIYFLFAYIVLGFFHQSYYFSYFLPFCLWRLKECEIVLINQKLRWGFLLTLFYGFFLCFLLQIAQIAENPVYVRTYNRILGLVRNKARTESNKKVWLPADIAMTALDMPNVRLHWEYYLDYKDWVKKIDTSSVFYIVTMEQLEYVNKYPFVPHVSLNIKELIPPVKGLLTVSPDFHRSEAIGLWEATVVDDRLITPQAKKRPKTVRPVELIH